MKAKRTELCRLDYTLDQLKVELLANKGALAYSYIDNKWAIMISWFSNDEEDDGKVETLRRLKHRGLGVWMARLECRLADLDILEVSLKRQNGFVGW